MKKIWYYIVLTILVMAGVILFTPRYLYLLWNLILAWIAYLLSHVVANVKKREWKGKMIIFFFLWMIFYPNAFYMITDYIHFQQLSFYRGNAYGIAYDTSLILWMTFAFHVLIITLALLLSFHAYKKVEKKIVGSGKFSKLIFLSFISIGVGVAMCVGRFHRLNSWDVFLAPKILFSYVKEVFSPKYMPLAGLFAGLHFLMIELLERKDSY